MTDVLRVAKEQGVKPTLAELERFEETPEGLDIDVGVQDKEEATHAFSNGDEEGELQNLQGKVIAIDGSKPVPATVEDKDIMKRSRGSRAEQLFAEGVEQDDAEWLIFDIQETGWRSRQFGELNNWLELNKPSLVLRSDGIGWISVICRSVS